MGYKQMKLFLGMQHVKQDYANTGLSDTEFAKLLSSRTKNEYSAAEVRNYRATLSIANNKPRDERDQQIIALRGLCVSMMAEAIRIEESTMANATRFVPRSNASLSGASPST